MNERKQFMENRERAKNIVRNIRYSNMQEALALMLANQCPSDTLPDEWLLFHFPLHCDGTVEIVAKKHGKQWIILRSRLIPDGHR